MAVRGTVVRPWSWVVGPVLPPVMGCFSPTEAEGCLTPFPIPTAESRWRWRMLTTSPCSVDLSVGIDDRRQLTPDQHHDLPPRRRQIVLKMEPAPFPTEFALHIAPNHVCSWNARARLPDRPVSWKSRRPRKAELGVHFIARDPECWRSLPSINQRAYSKCPQGRDEQKLALVVVLRRGQHGRP